MSLDTRIPLQVGTVDVANPLLQFTQIKRQKENDTRAAETQKLSNELMQLQITNEKFDSLTKRQKARLESSILGAAELDSRLQAGDTEGARNFLQQRRVDLGKRIAAGEDVDTVETDDALRLLDSDPDSLKRVTSQAIRLGQLTGILKVPDATAGGGATGAIVRGIMADNPGMTFTQALHRYQTGFRQGVGQDSEGNIFELPGYGDAKRNIKYKEESGKQDAILDKAEPIAAAKTRGEKSETPLPPTISQKQDELIEEIELAKGIQADLGSFIKKIDSGEVDLSVIANIQNKAKNFFTLSTEESRNLASFNSYLEKLRNDSLRLNKGVQTEGDAVRAFNEMFANINDPKVVSQRLREIQKLNARAEEARNTRLQTLRKEYGKDELKIENQPTSAFEEEKIPTGGNIGANINQGQQPAAAGGIKFLGFE